MKRNVLLVLLVAALICAAAFFACGDDDDDDADFSDDDDAAGDDDDNDAADDDDDDDNDDDDDDDDDDDTGPPEGYEDGDTMPDFTLLDSKGNQVSLHDHKGKVILLDSSATWCPPCNTDTPKLEKQFYQAYKDVGDGFIVLQLLGENDQYKPPTQQNLEDWIIKHKVTFPVLADPNWGVGDKIGNGYIPFYWVLDQNLVIQKQSDSPGIFLLYQFHRIIKDLLGIAG